MKWIPALLAVALLSWLPPTCAQMIDSMKSRDPWRLYVFVSTSMPAGSLIGLAREASRARATMVLRGFPTDDSGIHGAREYVAKINQACCDRQGPGWLVHPSLFQSFRVRAVPAFALTQTDDPQDHLSGIVTGDMSIANALKFFAQESQHASLRNAASKTYDQAFRGH